MFIRFLLFLVTTLCFPIAILYVSVKASIRSEYRDRCYQRLGIYPERDLKPGGLWIHACSVGEVESVLPLIRELKQRHSKRSLLVTTVTTTGAVRVRAEFGSTVQHAYLPVDSPPSVTAFLRKFKPQTAVIVEKEIWPVMFLMCQQREISLLLVNAMISERSFRRYYRWRMIFEPVFQAVNLVFAQSSKNSSKFEALGVLPDHIHVTGNLKLHKQIPSDLLDRAKQLRRQLFGIRPVFIAGSTHHNEDELILKSLSQAVCPIDDLVIILAPRHPRRSEDIIRICQENGFGELTRSSDQAMRFDQSVFILDTLGELFMYYAMADVAFVGGSLVEAGCHNVLEPAMLGIPVLFGSSVYNVENIVTDLVNCKAAIQVKDANQLIREMRELFEDSDKRKKIGKQGKRFVDSHHAESRKSVDLICSVLI